MALISALDDEYDRETKAQRAQQDLALRDRRAGEATLNPAVGSFMQGAEMGVADETTAAARSLFGTTDYDTALQQERAGQQKFSAEHPIADFALNAAGSIVPTLLGGRIIRGLRGEPEAPPPAAGTPPLPGSLPTPRSLTQPPPAPYVPAVPAAPTFGPTIANAAKLGAIQGGVTGFGEGEGGPMARLASALPASLVGGVLGGAAGGITHGVVEASRYPLEGLARFRGGAGAERGALDKIIQNTERSGGGVDDIATRFRDQNAGRLDLDAQGFPSSGTTLGEIMGPSVTPAMDAASQMPGKGSTQLRTQLTARGEGRDERVKQGLRAVFGDLEDDYTQRARLRQERSADAGPLYQNAWDNAKPLEPIDMLNLSHVPGEVFGDARKLARMEGTQGRQIAFEPQFDKEGFMLPLKEGQLPPTVEDMHRVKVSLGDFINAHTDVDGSMDALGNRAKNVRDAIKARLNELTTDDNGVSHYQLATNAWSEPSAEMAASKLGKGAANMNGSELQHRISLMSDPERQAFAAGFFGDLRDRLSKVDATGTANPVRAVFRDDKQRNAVNTALSALGIGADEADRRMALLTRFFGDEMAGSKTETQVLRNSATAQRQAWMRDLAVPAVGGTAVGGYSLASGDDPATALLKGIGTAAAGRLSGMARRGIAVRGTENMNDAMLALLGRTDAGAQQDAIRALQARALAARANAGGGTGFVGAVGGVTGQQGGPRISGGLGIPAGLEGLLSPPAPINDPRFQPQ